ncbi:MAG: FliM/FliN family flagellar motor switch protein [Deltaproteobacteria bacterium]|nr:FliM/FliN family flagellar motor switch protein [Deltaproteobacteria bacterium]MBI2500724.1 FliM/FliN family flagellar motor switch protein [Deltaproteobacteria bacterium]
MVRSPNIVPFDFGKLPHIGAAEVSLINAFHRFFPSHATSDELKQSVQELLHEELGSDFSFHVERVESRPMAQVLEGLPRLGIFLVIGLPPKEEKIVVDVDLLIAHAVVDRLLGGHGDTLAQTRTLSEIEEGVLSYLILKLLSHFYDTMGASPRVHFRLFDFCSNTNELQPYLKSGEAVIALTLQVRLGRQSGSFKMLIPSSILLQFSSADDFGLTEAEKRDRSERMNAFGFLPASLWVEGGRTTVRTGELSRLKEGDFVLLDEGGGDAVSLRVGTGERRSVRGKIISRERKLQVQLEEIFDEHFVGGI